MMHYDVYHYGGAKLSVVTDDPELARRVAWVNAFGYVHKWESFIDHELGAIGDIITELPIAETAEFMEWLSRETGHWRFAAS
jgi:hypothetical protein